MVTGLLGKPLILRSIGEPAKRSCHRTDATTPCASNTQRASQTEDNTAAQQQDPSHSAFTRRQLITGATLLSCMPARNAQAQASSSGSEDFAKQLENRLTEFTLANGLHVLVLERHNAPVVSCHTYAAVGAYDEEDGKTGLAHLLEHMAFKGTQRLGTKDFRREAALLDALDEVFYSMREADTQGNTAKAQQLSQQFVQLRAAADELAEPNEFGSTILRAGAVGLNAQTSHDATKYFVSLPANKLELWMAMEAERFRAPVFRELYSEKRVVFEERRLRIDNSPLGSFQEAFAGAAMTNNYRRPVIGYVDDLRGLGRQEVQDFFSRHYGPASLTIAVVGDVDPVQVERFAAKYFGDWQPSTSYRPPPTASLSPEPRPRPPAGERLLARTSRAGPLVMQAYYRPGVLSEDALVLDIACDLLSGGRSSRMQRRLMDAGFAYSATAVAAYPGEKHPSAVLLYGIPAAGRSLDQMASDLRVQGEQLAEEGPSSRELQRVQKASRLSLLSSFASNSGMASGLCSYHALTGSWRNITADLARVEGMTAADVQAVAARTFAAENCFTGYVMPA